MITALIAQKGGIGKSTIAIHLAGWHALAGKSVMLIDADRQSTAATWASKRAPLDLASPQVACQYGENLARAALNNQSRYDHILIDVASREPSAIRGALLAADIAITPFQANELDIWTAGDVIAMIREARARNPNLTAYAVINRAPTNPAATDITRASEALSQVADFSLMPTPIKERSSIRRCVPKGLLISEWRSPIDKKAQSELSLVFAQAYGENPPAN